MKTVDFKTFWYQNDSFGNFPRDLSLFQNQVLCHCLDQGPTGFLSARVPLLSFQGAQNLGAFYLA